MRDAIDELGADPAKINPLVPVDLVIDHSVQVDAFGNARAFDINADRDYERNRERYAFLRWGQQAFDNFRVVPPATGHLPPGQPRVPRPGRVQPRARRRHPGLPGHPGRHRLAHDDGQRARRARLGRRRDRGRGGDARPADLDAAAAGGRLQARRRAAGGRDRHRPRPHRHRDAARARRGLASSSSSSAPACTRSASPTGRRSATCRRSSARPARSSRSTARRCATSSSPAARPRRSSSSTPTRASRACSTTRAPRTRPSPRRSSSTSATVEPSIAGPKRPQDRIALADAKPRVHRVAGGVRSGRRRGARQRRRRGVARVVPGLRPAGRGPRRRARAPAGVRAQPRGREPRRDRRAQGRRR